jgi:amicoumacin kinase
MERAVAQLYRPRHLQEAAAAWGIEVDSARPLGDFENYVFAVRYRARPAILRLSHSSHRSPDQVRAELDFIDHLARGQVQVCRAIAADAGDPLQVMPADEGSFIAVLFEHARGQRPRRRDSALWNPALFTAWGATAGRMHRLARSHTPTAARRRPDWQDDDLIRDAQLYLPPDEPFVLERLAEATTWLAGLPRDPDSYGVIHGDLHHGNFHVDGGQLVLFDFDDASYHWFAHDIAVSLYHVYPADPPAPGEWESSARRFLEAYLRGYRTEQAIDPAWIARLPGFLRFRDIIMYVNFCKKRDLQALDPWHRSYREAVRERIRLGQPLVDPAALGIPPEPVGPPGAGAGG